MSRRRGEGAARLCRTLLAAAAVLAAAGAEAVCERGRAETLLLAGDFDQGADGFSIEPGTGNSWRLDPAAGVGDSGAWVADGVGPLRVVSLVAPVVRLPGDAEQLILSFRSRRALEGSGIGRCFDGALLEIDTGAGPGPVPAGAILADPYSGTIAAGFGNALAGLPAWCDELQAFRETRVDLGAYAGAEAGLRFTIATDESVELPESWRLDVLRVAACGPQDIIFGDAFEAPGGSLQP